MAEFSLTNADWLLIAVFWQTFFYGIYSGIFVLYLQHQTSKERTDNRPTFIFYPLCALYVLSTAVVITNVADIIFQNTVTNAVIEQLDFYRTFMTANIINGLCDFLAQSILIYRCWIVWNHNIRVITIPSIFAITFLGLWLASIGSTTLSSDEFETPAWVNAVTWTSFVMSISVNTLVTGFILFKIVKVYWNAKPLYNQNFGSTGRSKLRPLIFVVLESAMTLLCIQVAYLVLNIVPTLTAAHAYQVVSFIYQMFNGITPTIIQVRVAMGLSFQDQESLVEVASGLRFGSVRDTLDSMMTETEYTIGIDQENGDDNIPAHGHGIEHQEGEDNGEVGVERSNDFDIVEVST